MSKSYTDFKSKLNQVVLFSVCLVFLVSCSSNDQAKKGNNLSSSIIKSAQLETEVTDDFKIRYDDPNEFSNHIAYPEEYYLEIPFTTQAPYANWDALHEEACEEASMIMANEFYKGNIGLIDNNFAEREIQELVAWENSNGYAIDLEGQEFVEILKDYYGLESRIITNFTYNDIKSAINNNHPIIVPAAGRMLGNPNFKNPGPIYHALIIKGYTGNTLITNDPGTRNGFDYKYSFDTINNSAHEWNGGQVIHGEKLIIEVLPPN